MSPTIRLESVTKSYLMGTVEVLALRGIDLEINRGRVIGLMGPSGSGKTTLLNVIGGIDRPTAGNVFVEGNNIGHLDGRELDSYRCRTVGFIFQFFNLVPTLTARQNVELPTVIGGRSDDEIEERSLELLQLVGLENRQNHFPNQLSGGEQQRTAIAVALANDPPLLLADEPTGELDASTGEHMIGLLTRISRDLTKTVVIASHDSRLLRQCDGVLHLRDGRIVEGGDLVPTDNREAF